MKMKNFFVVLFFIMVSVSWYTYSHSTKKDISNLVKENVEALALEESGFKTHCAGSGIIDCPINDDKVEYVAEGYSLRLSY